MLSSVGRWFHMVFDNRSHDIGTADVGTSLLVGLVALGAIYVSIIIAPGPIGFLGAAFALVMMAIAVIDWRSYIIPNWLNAVGFGLAIAHAAAQEAGAKFQAIAFAATRGAVLALIFFALRYGYAQLRRRQGLGLGDVKLALVAGAWLDWVVIPVAIELAAFAALSAFLLRRLIFGRTISITARMPFGLFFAPAIWICWVLEVRWLELL